MKNIKTLILMSLIGMLFFVEFAFGQTSARSLAYRNSDEIAISPYAQAAPGDSYTFIGISHPSLTTSARKIGVVVETVGMTTSSNTPAGRSAVFTVSGGETHRVFVVNQGHSSINSSNSAFTGDRTHLIQTVDTPQFGSIRVSTVDEAPNVIANGTAAVQGIATTCATLANIQANQGCGYENLAQLSMWGIVYSEAAGTGFAMEFIGDMQDSKLQTGAHRADPRSGNRGSTEPFGTDAGVTSTSQIRPGAGVN
jgi:hypothetical protein